jgi:hypothetical protein
MKSECEANLSPPAALSPHLLANPNGRLANSRVVLANPHVSLADASVVLPDADRSAAQA